MAQNDFLQFDETQENTLTQEAYSTDVQRVGGVSSGLARSALFNKVMRQASTFVSGFGNFISEKEIDILEDLDSVKTALTSLFTAKNVGVSSDVQSALGVSDSDSALVKLNENTNSVINTINNSGINAFAKPVLLNYISINQSGTGSGNAIDLLVDRSVINYDFIRVYYNLDVSFTDTSGNSSGNIFFLYFTNINNSTSYANPLLNIALPTSTSYSGSFTNDFSLRKSFSSRYVNTSNSVNNYNYANFHMSEERNFNFYDNPENDLYKYSLYLYPSLTRAGSYTVSGSVWVFGYKLSNS